MRQSLITLGFFLGILSLPIAVTICGESVAQAYRVHDANDASAAFIGPVFHEASVESES